MYREGLAAALGRDGRVEVIGTAGSADAATKTSYLPPPDVIVIDPGDEPVGTLRLIARAVPTAQILAVAVRDDVADVVALAEAGAAGFVTRDEPIESFVAAVVGVARGDVHCSPRVAGALVRRVTALAHGAGGTTAGPRLTGRESQVADLLDQGLTNKQIAQALCIELATVKNHVHSVLSKLDAQRRSEVPARLRAVARI